MRQLTKAQEKRLRTAICCDELLYQKYIYTIEKIQREHKRLIRVPQQVYEVIVREPNGNARKLMVKHIYTMLKGTIIEVEL
jgi:hypothetical protein